MFNVNGAVTLKAANFLSANDINFNLSTFNLSRLKSPFTEKKKNYQIHQLDQKLWPVKLYVYFPILFTTRFFIHGKNISEL